MSSVDSDFIFERASELIYQGKLDEEVLNRFEVLAQRATRALNQYPLNKYIENLVLEIVRLARAG